MFIYANKYNLNHVSNLVNNNNIYTIYYRKHMTI